MKAILALVLVTACAEPAIEMKLQMPDETVPFDMSCVTAVDLLPIPVGDTKPIDIGERQYVTSEVAPCVDLPHAPTSFADVQSMIHGRFDIAIPAEGLAGVEIRGRAGACDDPAGGYHEAVFYGGAMYSGQDVLTIPLAHNISCDAATTYNVRPVDLVALVQTKTCADITSTEGIVYGGNIRPTMLDEFEPLEFESGASYHTLKMGVATISSYKSTWAGTCPALGWQDAGGYNSMCIPTANPTMVSQACAHAGEIDLPLLGGQWVQDSLDAKLMDDYLAPVIGDVWTTTAPAGPVMGATVVLDANSDAQIVYGDLGADKFTPAEGATGTGASGGFIIYTNQITGVTISAPGKASRHIWVGGGGEMPSASLTVIN